MVCWWRSAPVETAAGDRFSPNNQPVGPVLLIIRDHHVGPGQKSRSLPAVQCSRLQIAGHRDRRAADTSDLFHLDDTVAKLSSSSPRMPFSARMRSARGSEGSVIAFRSVNHRRSTGSTQRAGLEQQVPQVRSLANYNFGPPSQRVEDAMTPWTALLGPTAVSWISRTRSPTTRSRSSYSRK